MHGRIIIKKIDSNKEKEIKTQIKNIVNLHLLSFKGFFLSFLGPNFLYLLYLNIAKDKNGIILVAEDDEKLVGFVAGVTEQRRFYVRMVRRQFWRFALAAIPALIRKPSILLRLFRAIKRPKETSEYSSQACLMSIGVDPNHQGKGIGEMLIREFCDQLMARGHLTFCLTTDKYNNEKVNKFYQKQGFKLVRTFVTPEGRVMNEYLKIMEKEQMR